MKKSWIIAKRELSVFFDSLIGYFIIVAFLGFTGFFTWLYGSDIFFVGQASLDAFFNIAYWTLFFFIPAITMRMLAEEKRSGTIELLLTKPVTDWQIVTGKFLSTLILILITLALTLPYYVTVWSLGPIDHGVVWSGYLGLLLMSAVYISVGLFASSLTRNQLVAFLLALLIGIFFHIIFEVLGQAASGQLSDVLGYLNLSSHYDAVSRGVVDTSNLIYFLSLTFLGLVLSEFGLAKRNITG
jgi:ABC-2 type transport system permease protein